MFEEGSGQGLGDEEAEKRAARAQLDQLAELFPERATEIRKATALLDRVKGDEDAQDEFVKSVLSLLDGTEPDANEGLEEVRAGRGSEVLASLAGPLFAPADTGPGTYGGGLDRVDDLGDAGADGGAQSVGSFFGSIFGRVGQVLNFTTWYTMKNRAGVVGESGVAAAVRKLRGQLPAVRVHLVGHSLGGRLMAACGRSLAAAPKVQADSMTLLQAAFSHYGLSPDNGKGKRGAFRSVITDRVVKGPLVATFSAKDKVVGTVYTLASKLARDNVQDFGDGNDQFGGIGRNGAQRTLESRSDRLRRSSENRYEFELGKVNNLDGSDDLINSHGDITNEHVTYAFSCVLEQT